MAAVRVSAVTAEGGDLDRVVVGLSLRSIAADGNQHHAELRAHGVGLREEASDFVGSGRSGHVVVGGFAAENQVPHAAAREIRRMAVAPEGFADLPGTLPLARTPR